MTPAPVARLGSYELLAAIGAGGMGEVYRARGHEAEGETFAVRGSSFVVRR